MRNCTREPNTKRRKLHKTLVNAQRSRQPKIADSRTISESVAWCAGWLSLFQAAVCGAGSGCDACLALAFWARVVAVVRLMVQLVKCGNCGEVTEKESYVMLGEVVPISKSRGQANLVQKPVDYSFGGDKEEQQKLSYDKEQQEKLSDDKEAGEGEVI
uniref:Uncharacterized protein n=1 Tax=Chenopodium quinoa TaxID=63459 RepID=A0A803M695_CHEQI